MYILKNNNNKFFSTNKHLFNAVSVPSDIICYISPELNGGEYLDYPITTSNGNWSFFGNGPTYSYSWYIDGVLDASLGYVNTVTPSSSYMDKMIKCKIVAENAYGTTEIFSNEIQIPNLYFGPPINITPPAISGDIYELITVNYGTWDKVLNSIDVSWFVDSIATSSLGTSSSIYVSNNLSGKNVKAFITVWNEEGSASAWSNEVSIPWFPSELGNIISWFDASATQMLIVDSDGKVEQWNDRSGNVYNITQESSADRPTYSTNQIHQRSALTFSFGHCLSGAATISHSGHHASVFIAKASSTGQGIFQMGSLNDAGSVFTSGSSLAWVSRARGSNPVASITMSANTYEIVAHSTYPSFVDIYRFGEKGVPGSGSNNTPSTDKTLTVGSLTQTVYPLNGGIAELILFNVALSGADLQKVEGYLAHKYNKNSLLISGHPYINSPP